MLPSRSSTGVARALSRGPCSTSDRTSVGPCRARLLRLGRRIEDFDQLDATDGVRKLKRKDQPFCKRSRSGTAGNTVLAASPRAETPHDGAYQARRCLSGSRCRADATAWPVGDPCGGPSGGSREPVREFVVRPSGGVVEFRLSAADPPDGDDRDVVRGAADVDQVGEQAVDESVQRCAAPDGGGGAEPVQAGVEVLIAPLDEAVGEQQQGRAGGQGGHSVGAGAGGGGAQPPGPAPPPPRGRPRRGGWTG